jgi:hypothetical protein
MILFLRQSNWVLKRKQHIYAFTHSLRLFLCTCYFTWCDSTCVTRKHPNTHTQFISHLSIFPNILAFCPTLRLFTVYLLIFMGVVHTWVLFLRSRWSWPAIVNRRWYTDVCFDVYAAYVTVLYWVLVCSQIWNLFSYYLFYLVVISLCTPSHTRFFVCIPSLSSLLSPHSTKRIRVRPLIYFHPFFPSW